MGCNCKASQYVRRAKKKYGYDPETHENISKKEKIKLTFRAIIIWVIMIVGFPIILLSLPFLKIFKRRKGIKIFNAITVRL